MEKNYLVSNYIGVFDGFFKKEICQKLINYFEYRKNLTFQRNDQRYRDQSITIGFEADFEQNGANSEFVFTQIDMPVLFNELQKIFWEECFPLYVEHMPFCSDLKNIHFGSVKIQKTMPGGGYHAWHFENANLLTAKRVMFIILYLNDVVDGGETEFLYQASRVQPITGRLVLSPAGYTHVHRGNPPLTKEKYILTTWLEYMQ